jgi:hypothetical protein
MAAPVSVEEHQGRATSAPRTRGFVSNRTLVVSRLPRRLQRLGAHTYPSTNGTILGAAVRGSLSSKRTPK